MQFTVKYYLYCSGILRKIHTDVRLSLHDDTNFLYASHSLKKLNKTINFDLSNLVQWLRANKISLNVNKKELVIF